MHIAILVVMAVLPVQSKISKSFFASLLLSGALLLPYCSFSQLNTPKYSNEFMNLGVSGRGLGMGNSQVAVVDDVTSGYWNPAGLTRIEDRFQASVMHASYFAGMANYDYLALSFKPDSLSRLSVSAIRFAVDDIPDTRFLYDADGRLNYDNIRFFSAADYGFLLSYARKAKRIEGLSLGLSAKIIHRSVGQFATAWGFGLDAGLQYEKSGWQYGLMLRDVSGTFNAWSHDRDMVADAYALTGNELPENGIELTVPRAILGVARPFQLSGDFSLLASADLVMTFDGRRNVILGTDAVSIDPAGGFELGYRQTVFVRGGVNNMQRVRGMANAEKLSIQPNFGLGFRLNKLRLDYALTDIGDMTDTPYSHIFSLVLSF
jgi:hypothetical protein